jgi:hypothetical protein
MTSVIDEPGSHHGIHPPERSTLIIGSLGEITTAVITEIEKTMKGENERHVFRK